MSKWSRWFLCATALAGTGAIACAASLTPDELRWLQASAPVGTYAQSQGLPLDVVVQPQDSAGAAPLAMAYIGGRCKLVFSMRGNPAVQEALAGVEGAFAELAIETMAAHELGHCWRYVRGDWHVWPAGFSSPAAGSGSGATQWVEMNATRREEGYADLVALAYVQNRYPAAYGRVHRWLTDVRQDQPIEGAHHDTRAWVRMAQDPAVWDEGPHNTVFDQATVLWRRGL